MKFAISAVVMLALACGAQSSILPWGGVYGGPAAIGLAHGPALIAGGWGHGGWGHGTPGISLSQGVAWGGVPAAVAVHAPAAVAVHAAPIHAAPAILAHEGQYVAKTRGAIHTAPLAGHINSAASINVAPAPGTL